MDNLEIREFQQTVINFTNQCCFPIEVKRLIFADILAQVNVQAEEAVQKELMERQQDSANQEKNREAEVYGDVEQAVSENKLEKLSHSEDSSQ